MKSKRTAVHSLTWSSQMRRIKGEISPLMLSAILATATALSLKRFKPTGTSFSTILRVIGVGGDGDGEFPDCAIGSPAGSSGKSMC